MSESKKNDMEIIKTRLATIDYRLENIEKLLGKTRKDAGYYFAYSLGFAAMVVGASLAIADPDRASSWLTVCLLGVAVSVFSFFWHTLKRR